MQIIKTKKQAAEIIKNMDITEEILFENDPSISMINGGNTILTRVEDDLFTDFSYGQNWSDQIATELTEYEAVEYLFKKRKCYNDIVRKMNNPELFF